MKELIGTVVIPANTGINGFLSAVRQILQRPRIQHITIDSTGKVSYARQLAVGESAEQEEANYGVNLDGLRPYTVVRNSHLIPVSAGPPTCTPLGTLHLLIFRGEEQGMHPTAIVVGDAGNFWGWASRGLGIQIGANTRSLFGLPVLVDPDVPEGVLLLCFGYGGDAELVDTKVVYKLDILTPNEVQVL